MYENSQIQGAKPPNLPDPPFMLALLCSPSNPNYTSLMSYHYRVEVQKKNGWNRQTFQDFSSCSDTRVTV